LFVFSFVLIVFATPSGTSITAGGTITDNAGNAWTIDISTQGGAVAVNGIADTMTWYVVKVAYVNGMKFL
jgi:hypothetical protein